MSNIMPVSDLRDYNKVCETCQGWHAHIAEFPIKYILYQIME